MAPLLPIIIVAIAIAIAIVVIVKSGPPLIPLLGTRPLPLEVMAHKKITISAAFERFEFRGDKTGAVMSFIEWSLGSVIAMAVVTARGYQRLWKLGVLLMPAHVTYEQIMAVVGRFKGALERKQPEDQIRHWQ